MEMNHHHHGHHGQPSPIAMKLIAGGGAIVTGKNTRLVFRPVNSNHPEASVPLSIQHEAAFHLIIVNDQLTSFEHLHPQHDADGHYFIDVTFNQPGKYLVYADYQAEGYAPQTDRLTLEVEGGEQPAPGETNEKRSADTDGLHLAIAATAPFVAGAESHIPVAITKDGKALNAADINPYLGAVAHIIMIGREDKDFLHIHPMSDSRFPIIGHTVFPKADIYRMWIQFKTEGVLHTASFTIQVGNAAAEVATGHAHHHHHH
ncbi:hypothetical protein HF329_24990 [Chitinophaga oryzae]|uniref:Secreted protein n=1 Tax=Chitinophaga oryzae TaxID=2725414 RepID=A0AAE6ZJI6_9BACT|nr:hypothetical protein [Chitinophaga oryzae]QJB34374.1 hypothetical protein HF329_24990 [Chitinophaga oryzae]